METRLRPNSFLISGLSSGLPKPNKGSFLYIFFPMEPCKKKPNLLKLLPQRLFPTKALVPLNIYSTIKLCLLFQLSTVYSSSLHHKEKGGVGSKTYEGCLTHPITRRSQLPKTQPKRLGWFPTLVFISFGQNNSSTSEN